MRWIRKILQSSFEKEKKKEIEPTPAKVYVPSCGWGFLESFNEKGVGYIRFDNMSGQLIRNWDHFIELVEIIESQEKEN